MEAFERLAEQRILEAMEQGEFDNLPGAGKPLILNDHPFVPDELWTHKILRNAACRRRSRNARRSVVWKSCW
jgi:DnaJ homologue, subfamily C, member 28, conserved domain